MKTRNHSCMLAGFTAVLAIAAPAIAGEGMPQGGTPNLPLQLQELKAKVELLEQQLQNTSGMADSTMSGAGMPGMKMGMGMMKGMRKMSDGSGSMPGMKMGNPGMGGMGMMGMMKGKGGASGMSMPSALPGFPGASHLYHIGATGFFLDHQEHLKLGAEQQAQLNQIKEKASLAQATAERKIEETEQQLWQLTASDQPDVKAIESKIREIEKLRGDQRLDFIRAVGEAAKVLSHEQHQLLTGAHSAPDATHDSSTDHTKH